MTSREMLLFAALWCAATALVPDNVFWRDSGEFLVAATYLDVSHPAGFPLWGQLGNLFAQIPFGPLAWRIHAFSMLCAVSACLLLVVATRKVLSSLGPLPVVLRKGLSYLPPVLLLSSSAFLKQSQMAEVYLLNLCLMLGLLLCYLKLAFDQDRRYLILAGFLGGLGLGNHVSLVLFLAVALILLTAQYRDLLPVLPAALVAGLVGLSIYAYVPARAITNPPLNTGEASSFDGFLALVTDRRDFALRPEVLPAYNKGEASWFVASAKTAVKDFAKFQKDTTALLPLLGVVGIIAIGLVNVWLGVALFLFAGSNWLFFQGWSTDPFGPVIATFSLAASVLPALIWKAFKKSSSGLRNSICCLSCVALLTPAIRLPENIANASNYRQWHLAEEVVGEMLGKVSYGSLLISEQSWFVVKYLQTIEGLRPDITTLYLPGILFPAYFHSHTLVNSKGEEFKGSQDGEANPALPNMKNFSRLVQYLPQDVQIKIEPGQSLNVPLAGIARLASDGMMTLIKGKPGVNGAEFIATWYRLAELLRKNSDDPWGYHNSDTTNYLEAAITGVADLLSHTGQAEEAEKLLRYACEPVDSSSCSIVSLNNIAVYLMEQGRFKEAAALLLRAFATKATLPEPAINNLKTALEKLTEEEVVEFKRSYSEVFQRLSDI